ncbi:MAG: cob(I)yrinic acid a,c-diamide adenosyltransferase [Patescibacteria group bacterium]
MSDPKSRGLLQVYTGNGKGKTTASLGMAIRAAAQGMKVAIIYFDKGGTHYSERRILEQRFGGEIDFWATGLDRIDPINGRFRFGVTADDREEAQRGLEIVQALFDAGSHDLMILDEINTTVSLGMLDEADALDTLALKPDDMEVVLTGRDAPESFMEHADLVSEVRLVKHYFYQGVPAREGIDF